MSEAHKKKAMGCEPMAFVSSSPWAASEARPWSSLYFMLYRAPGRPLAKAKEKAKKECPPQKFHSAKTPFFPLNTQQIGPCQ